MKRALQRKLIRVERTRAFSAEERARHILDERTARLAERSGLEPVVEPDRALICAAGGERFGISLDAIAEILPFRECVPVPDAPPAMIGVFGRNGQLVSVLDLAVALGLQPAANEDGEWHLVMLRQAQPQVALKVDRAYAVSEIMPLAETEAGTVRNEAVTGYAKALSGFADEERVLSLLDTTRLLRPFLLSTPVPGV
ncbi:chemotaxis protein CheW [Microvirga sp. P5_D2]